MVNIYYNTFGKFPLAHSYSNCEIYKQDNISSPSSLIAFSFSFQAPSMFLYFPLAAYF